MEKENLCNLTIKKIYSALRMYNGERAKGSRKNRSAWAICYKFEGKTEYRSGEKVFISDKTRPIVLPAGCQYEWVCLEKGSFFSIEFEAEETADIFSFEISNPEKLLKLMETAKRFSSGAPASVLKQKAIVYEILGELLLSEEKKYLPERKREILQPAVSYLHANYAEKIENDDLAAIAGVSTVYFRKLFRDAYGTSPIAYLNALRIQKAKALLKSDFGKISEVAQAVGFNDIYSFSKAFRAHTGASPREYAMR